MSKSFERKRLSRGSFSLKCTKYKTLEIICMIYNNEKTILAARYVFQTSLDALESIISMLLIPNRVDCLALDSASFRTYKLQPEYRILGLELSSKFMVVQAITQDLEPANQRSFVYRIDYEKPDNRYGIKYLGKELEFLKRVAGAHKKKNLVEFQKIIDTSQEVINQDSIIQAHVQDLYENLLELNLLKSIKPYSKVQLSHIAKHMNLEVRIVQEKLSEMIIDRKINGTLDQGIECLIVFDEVEQGELYSSASNVLTNMDTVVDKLFQKVEQLKAIS